MQDHAVYTCLKIDLCVRVCVCVCVCVCEQIDQSHLYESETARSRTSDL